MEAFQLAEFCYIKEKAAWLYLLETRFREAGVLFLESRTDPRLLIRLFPDISGKMLENAMEDRIDVYKGLQHVLGETTLHSMSIDGISKLLLLKSVSFARRGSMYKRNLN